MRLEFSRERLDCSGCRLAASKAIDGCIPERSVEPWNKAFSGRRLIRPIHHLDERILQDVFSQFTVAHTALEIPQESAVALDQDIERRRRLVRKRESDGAITGSIPTVDTCNGYGGCA